MLSLVVPSVYILCIVARVLQTQKLRSPLLRTQSCQRFSLHNFVGCYWRKNSGPICWEPRAVTPLLRTQSCQRFSLCRVLITTEAKNLWPLCWEPRVVKCSLFKTFYGTTDTKIEVLSVENPELSKVLTLNFPFVGRVALCLFSALSRRLSALQISIIITVGVLQRHKIQVPSLENPELSKVFSLKLCRVLQSQKSSCSRLPMIKTIQVPLLRTQSCRCFYLESFWVVGVPRMQKFRSHLLRTES